MAPGNPPPPNESSRPGGAGTPPRRSTRNPGAGGPSQAPWAPTGATTPRSASSTPRTPGAPRQPASGPTTRAAAGTRANAGTPAPTTTRRGAAAGAAAGAGAAAAGSGRRRLIDYPRQGKTGVRRWLPSWKLVSGTFLFFVLLGVGAVAVAYATTDIPTPADLPRAQTTTVYFADGETEIGRFSEQDRVLVDSETIPQHVKDAVVAAEDRSFYDNPGINPAGIARALWNNVRGGDQQGGSSITQQYAERYYYGDTITSYSGKIREAFLAVKLDRQQDKDEILVNYLNTIYFGRDSYGIEVAAQSYFGVGVDELDISQAALIAGVIPSPNNFDPRVNPEEAERRWNYVLDGMVTTGTLSQADRDAQEFPETIEVKKSDTNRGWRGYVLSMVRDEAAREASLEEADLNRNGYRIVTTISQPMQRAAVVSVRDTLPEDAPENLRTGLVTLDPASGAIKALYGGEDFLEVSRNAVTQDRAQAGSTFKPFTLVAHLESGNSLRSVYNGASGLKIEGWEEEGLGNFADESFGYIDVVEATAKSVNTVYAQMNLDVGPEKTTDVAIRAGVPEDTKGLTSNVSNVLGTASPHPLDMATAFNTFAAQGVRHDPYVIQAMEYLDGETVYEPDTRGERVFEEDVMADTTYALTQVVERGSGSKAQALGRPVAGKTGTSSDNKSAWFIGYTPQLTTAVAMFQVGEDGSEEEMTDFGGVTQVTGATFPASIWTAYMTEAMDGMEVVPFPERADVGKPPVVEVPDVVGLGADEAEQRLDRAGFGVSRQGANDPDVPAGTVLSQNPTGEARQGSTVTITVSEGPDTDSVPNVVGQSAGDAAFNLRQAGFEVASERTASDQPAGQVISQNPGAGTEVEPGSTVSIVVSDGPGAATVPNVVGMQSQQASNTLRQAGFEVAVQEVVDAQEAGVVISQNPGGGEAPPGSTVTITVSTGPGDEENSNGNGDGNGDGETDTGGSPQAGVTRWWDSWSARRT